MKKLFQPLALATLWLTVGSGSAQAAEAFDYPELQVTPRASERLETEAKREGGRRWTTHLPVQTSALTTLTAGFLQLSSPDPSKDPSGRTGWAGIAVGGAWLAVTGYLSASYRPYSSSLVDVNEMTRKSPREILARERAAEEAIQKAARLGNRLRWLSFLTHAGTSAYLLANAQSGSISFVADIASLGFSIAPMIFRYHWQDVAREQADYKKRIYGPVASAALLTEPITGRAAPGAVLSLSF